MPPIQPIPTLFQSTLKCYGIHCLLCLIRSLDSELEECDEEERITRTENRESLLKEARLYVQDHTVSFIQNELLKFVVNEIVEWRWSNVIREIVFSTLSKTCDVKDEVQWKTLRNFMVMLGDERIRELDFSNGNEQSNSIEHHQMEDILSDTLFQNSSWSEKLVTLKLDTFTNFEIVKAIGCHCRNLEYLDIKPLNSDDLQDDSHGRNDNFECLSYLYGAVDNVNSGCPKLRTIVLPKVMWEYQRKIADHAVKMIRFMPDLCVIRNVDTMLVAFKYMEAASESSTMKLTEFEEWCTESQRFKSEKENKGLGDLLPDVKRYSSNVCLFSLYSRGLRLVQILNSFSSLEVIEVHDSDKNILKGIERVDPMPSVKVLKLFEIHDDISINKIQTLNAKFPYLENLMLHLPCYKRVNDDVVQIDILFPNLKELGVSGVGKRLDVSFFKIFLEKCPSLRILELFCVDEYLLGGPSALNDSVVEQLSYSMENLEKVNIAQDSHSLHFGDIRLTYKSALCIISACPNLRYLGNLFYWSVVEDEINMIKTLITNNNWDLHLLERC